MDTKQLKREIVPPKTVLRNYRTGRVSVVIPTYNYRHFVSHAIDSALNQSEAEIEIIVVDDGSTDGTFDYLKKYKNKITYIHQENAGLSAARNTGIQNSSGEYVLFLDADDILGSGTISSQKRCIQDLSDSGVAVCPSVNFTKVGGRTYPKATGKWHLFKDYFGVHLCYFNIAPPHAFLFHRNAVLKTGAFDTGLTACEDYDFLIRMAMSAGYIPRYNPAGMVYYRRHAHSMSANLKNQYIHDAILHRRLSMLLDRHPRFPEGQRLEGLLAFSAGMLLTATRLHSLRIDGGSDLLGMAQERLKEAVNIAGYGDQGWNMLLTLYTFRIFSNLAHPYYKSSRAKEDIIRNLYTIMKALNAPLSKRGLVCGAFFSKISESYSSSGEREALARAVLTYFKNYVSGLLPSPPPH